MCSSKYPWEEGLPTKEILPWIRHAILFFLLNLFVGRYAWLACKSPQHVMLRWPLCLFSDVANCLALCQTWQSVRTALEGSPFSCVFLFETVRWLFDTSPIYIHLFVCLLCSSCLPLASDIFVSFCVAVWLDRRHSQGLRESEPLQAAMWIFIRPGFCIVVVSVSCFALPQRSISNESLISLMLVKCEGWLCPRRFFFRLLVSALIDIESFRHHMFDVSCCSDIMSISWDMFLNTVCGNISLHNEIGIDFWADNQRPSDRWHIDLDVLLLCVDAR